MRGGVHAALAAFFLAFALATAAPAVAQPLDLSQGGPITVTALGNIEWRQNQQEVIARGDARAIRGAVTVTADELVAHYRPKPNANAAKNAAAGKDQAGAGSGEGALGAEEIYRLVAIGDVHIFTATDQAFGDHAVYDTDEAVLVLTGRHLKLTTPNDVLTARDDIEYWPQKHMAVARGDAVVVTNDGRRLSADTLVAYTNPASGPTTTPGAVTPASAATAKSASSSKGAASSDALLSGGSVKRIEAFGHVTVRTTSATVTGDRGVYVPSTQIALIVGNVHITRGQNQLNGARGVIDMKTGVADLLSEPGRRVQGLVVPNSADEAPPAAHGGSPAPQPPGAGR